MKLTSVSKTRWDHRNRYHGPFTPIASSQVVQLDALRGMSALGVAIGHANQFFIGPTNPAGNIFFGLIAQGSVMVFFVLSGFLISKSITRNIEHNGGEGFGLGRYATDRLWRIYPPLLFAIGLMFVLWLIAPLILPSGTTQFVNPNPNYGRQGINLDWPSIWATLRFRNGFSTGSPDMNGPLWSLSVEVWYYVIAGGTVALIRRPLLLIGFLAIMWVYLRRNADFTDYAIVWVGGYLVSLLHNQDRLNSSYIFAALAVACITALSFAILFAKPELLASDRSWIRYYNVAAGISFALVLAAILKSRLSLPDVISSLFNRAASYSYTLYLIHVPIFLIVFGALEKVIVGDLFASVAAAVSGVAISVVAAWAASHVVENKLALTRYGSAIARFPKRVRT